MSFLGKKNLFSSKKRTIIWRHIKRMSCVTCFRWFPQMLLHAYDCIIIIFFNSKRTNSLLRTLYDVITEYFKQF